MTRALLPKLQKIVDAAHPVRVTGTGIERMHKADRGMGRVVLRNP